MEAPPPKKLLSIAWDSVQLTSEADALALWQQIAPTGADWEEKVQEIPETNKVARQLALALLRGGNMTCVQPQPATRCAPTAYDVPAPAPDATFADPCLRRMLALWALDAIEPEDTAWLRDALRAMVSIPAPESALVDAALSVVPPTEVALRVELLAAATAAGHREIANTKVSGLDDDALVELVTKHHVDGALDLLSAATHRAAFLRAIGDEKLARPARLAAMTEAVEHEWTPGAALPRELRTVLVNATKSPDCAVAAAAARALVTAGERKFAPARPATRRPAVMMRALCVLASYEALVSADEPSYLLGYVPKRGLEYAQVTRDPYNDTDEDGDGDPHTIRAAALIPRDQVVLPEYEDFIRAFERCTGTTCSSPTRDFKLTFKPGPGGELFLARLEVVDQLPCPGSAVAP